MSPNAEQTVARWRLALDWMNWSFEAYLRAQVSQGRSREDALARLKAAWERQDRERLEAISRIGILTSRAR